MSGHEGEEFGFVLQGRVILHLGDQRHTLRNGECFYFRADTEHWLANPGKRRAIVLWVACPPSF
jgi:mannose-6-phosphate isomerase-like protein (cupin superfamily)